MAWNILEKLNPFKSKEDLSYQSPVWRQVHYRGMYLSAKVTKKPIAPQIGVMRANIVRYRDLTDRFNAKYETLLCWQDIAIIHALECGSSFLKCLHNGEYLIDVNAHGTILVPAGRGKGLGWTWEDAAMDALELEYKSKKQFPKTMKIEEHLFFLEQYNGLGYLKFHSDCPSPYLWSYTNHYTKGKYDFDGQWNNNLVSNQCGAVAYYLTLGDPLI